MSEYVVGYEQLQLSWYTCVMLVLVFLYWQAVGVYSRWRYPKTYWYTFTYDFMWSCDSFLESTERLWFNHFVTSAYQMFVFRASSLYCPSVLQPGRVVLLLTFGKASGCASNGFCSIGAGEFADAHRRCGQREFEGLAALLIGCIRRCAMSSVATLSRQEWAQLLLWIFFDILLNIGFVEYIL